MVELFETVAIKIVLLELIPVLGNASADFNIKQKIEKRKDPSKGKKVHKIIILETILPNFFFVKRKFFPFFFAI